MIEPHSAQLGASSWILNATFVAPRESVTTPALLPFDFAVCPLAWPLVATTARSSRAAEEAPPETTLAVAAGEFPPPVDASLVFVVDCSAAGSARGAASTA